nr:branched-chain amino acid ABC transporter permease [Desulfofundulus thermobenzoicus]
MEQVLNGLQLGFMYALIALGYTMVYGVVQLINFAHGDVFMVGAFIGYFGFAVWGLPLPLAILTAMVFCAVLGVVIERIAYRPLRYAPKIAALISALGVSLFLEYFSSMKFIFGPNYRVVPRPIQEVHWNIAGLEITNIQVMVIVVVVIMLVLLQFLIYRTRIGMAMRTVAVDHNAARLMGVNVDNTISATFAIGSAFAALGGVLYAIAYAQIQPFMGIMPGLKAFTAAVLGGIGIIPGAVLGALIMGQVETLTSAYISSQMRDAIAFAVLILVLLIRPTGLLGRTETEKV